MSSLNENARTEMIEKINCSSVYSAMKSEIYYRSQIENQTLLTIYTASLVLFPFAFNYYNPWLFLAEYLLLLPCQSIIYRQRRYIYKISAYISVFLDYPENIPQWERELADVDTNNKFLKAICYGAPVLLGALSSVSAIICAFNNVKIKIDLNITMETIINKKIFPVIIISIILFLGNFYLNISSNMTTNLRNKYISIFEKMYR